MLLELDFYVGTAYPDLVITDPFGGRWSANFTTRNLELGTVPRAGDLITLQLPLGEWTPTVRTGVIDGVVPAL